MNFVEAGEPLDASQNRDLARRARAGDVAARERLILGNKGLVFHPLITPRYRALSHFLPFDDITQEAWLTMTKAAHGWDPERGEEFSTYAFRALSNRVGQLFHAVTRPKRTRAVDLGVDGRGRQWLDQAAAPPDDHAEQLELRDEADYLLSFVGDREAEVVRRQHGIGCEAETIRRSAVTFGVSSKRVQDIREAAAEKIAARCRWARAGGLAS